MNAEVWNRTTEQQPNRGELVDTMSPNGLQQTLKYVDGLWFDPDSGIYMYYVPEFWRRV